MPCQAQAQSPKPLPKNTEQDETKRFALPDEFAAIQTDRFDPKIFSDARAQVIQASKAHAEFTSLETFPIAFSVVSKLTDNAYEVRNRTTGQVAIIKTTKTVYETIGNAFLMVSSAEPVELPLKNGFTKKFSVFVESEEDYDKGSDRYFNLRTASRDSYREFWKLIHKSNAAPPKSVKECARLFGVKVSDLDGIITAQHIGNWTRAYNDNLKQSKK